MTIPLPITMQLSPAARDPMIDVFYATIQSPKVRAASIAIRDAQTLTRIGRSSVPGQLTISPWLGSPNGTTEEFLFVQSLDAGGRRKARTSMLDVSLLDAELVHAETIVAVYVQILTELSRVAAAEREILLATRVERNSLAAYKIIEAQVAAGAKPGSDADLAKVIWNEARIATELTTEKVGSQHIKIEAFGLKIEKGSSGRLLPEISTLVPSNLLERRAHVSTAKLGTERSVILASSRPDISMVVRSQNFTRNFTPNDRGLAVQVSIPIDHGSIRAQSETFTTQISTLEARLTDELLKQASLRASILANISSLNAAISKSKTTVISPLGDYTSRMQRAYLAGSVPVTAYLDAQRSLHDAERRLMKLQDERDQEILQLVEHCGLIPGQLVSANQKRDRK